MTVETEKHGEVAPMRMEWLPLSHLDLRQKEERNLRGKKVPLMEEKLILIDHQVAVDMIANPHPVDGG